ncbi:hypothetical protein [Haloechinothrix salitolerans]|uniref:Uncharacterized protein n=1 Tax=Haloechinothrix salitolerans TaxID=926830 RepID=A0ABW2BZH3_9PSEU
MTDMEVDFNSAVFVGVQFVVGVATLACHEGARHDQLLTIGQFLGGRREFLQRAGQQRHDDTARLAAGGLGYVVTLAELLLHVIAIAADGDGDHRGFEQTQNRRPPVALPSHLVQPRE